MNNEFRQSEWNRQLEHDLRQLIRLAILEDLDRGIRLDDGGPGARNQPDAQASVVARQAGVAAGVAVGEIVLDEMNCQASWQPRGGRWTDAAARRRLGGGDGSGSGLVDGRTDDPQFPGTTRGNRHRGSPVRASSRRDAVLASSTHERPCPVGDGWRSTRYAAVGPRITGTDSTTRS